jgi:hypothetical protein
MRMLEFWWLAGYERRNLGRSGQDRLANLNGRQSANKLPLLEKMKSSAACALAHAD